MKLKYPLTALVMGLISLGWSLLDQRSFNAFWWILAIAGFALSAAFFVIDGKAEA